MKNIGIYIRKSRESENQKSLKEQILLGTEFCNENNFNAIIYNDGIVSGAGKDKRPQFEKMLVDISRGKLYGIYIWNTDRTARDEIAWHTLANLLKDNNVYLFDNGVKADFSDENTLLFYTIKSGMDAYFSRVTSSKIKAVLNRNAKEGKFSGILKFGYERDMNGKIIINDSEALTVKRIFNLCIAGSGYKAIAEKLNSENIPTRYSKMEGTYKYNENKHGGKTNIVHKSKKESKWTSAVVGKILRSRQYIGEKKYKGNILDVPAIVKLSIFNKAQEIIDKRKNKSGKRSVKKYLLNDLIMCGKCGRRYTGRTIHKHKYYRCASLIVKGGSCGTSGIRMNDLDAIIWNYFFNDIYLLQALARHKRTSTDAPNNKELKKEIEKLNISHKAKEKELNNVTKFLVQGIINEKEAQTQLKRIRQEINDIQVLWERKQEQIDTITTTTKQITAYEDEIKSLHENTPFDEKKLLIEKHVQEITISTNNNNFNIELSFKSFDHNKRIIFNSKISPVFNVVDQVEYLDIDEWVRME